ncbi:hypothetical protein FB562_0120 [Homoserinimonas aerilata]|uniref:Uncharacterized protein n=1 Tax=Homoserinimonas aerilata TaxID=1162970 RepID=A0A542YGH6_9MICO|nr:DUF6226 family protein [Homoserinimonas aerilata]TQL47074.1 hypothetical protein FB562_0120 [Homoserinimonas aerilata]
MNPYRRPHIETRQFSDAAGQVIEYGNRWGADSPPDDSCSVTSNLERYLPLHTVAAALIEHLTAAYDVSVDDDLANGADILHERDDIIRAVRIVPRDPAAAPLTFVFTSFPSVIVHAGTLVDFLFPFCGCDACDTPWEYEVDELEWRVLAVVAGGLSERHSGREFGHTLEAVDGGARSGGESLIEQVAPERLAAAASVIDSVPDGWASWPPSPSPLQGDASA